MRNFKLFIIQILLSILFCGTAISQDLCEPVGWATQNGGVTGGGNATPVVVSNYSELDNAIDDEDVKVIHVSGTITIPSGGRLSFQDQSDKSILGLPGARLVSNDQSSGGSGIMQIKRVDNAIIRNVVFEGPGAYDVDGNDNLTVEDSRNIWVDHCTFEDGCDGNFDIKSEANYISVTWCIFRYRKPPRSGGPGGSDDHRYSNLIGSSDGATENRGKLNVTFQYCQWGEGVRERMPRVRFGKIHMVNNLFNSDVDNYGIRAGYEADLRIEGNYFDDQDEPIDFFDGDYTAIYANNNIGQDNVNDGNAFTPPYSLNIANPNDIVNPILTCAGATLNGPNGCSSCSEDVTVTDCNGVENGSAYIDECNQCVGGNTGRTECVVDCNGDQNGSAYLDNCGVCVEGSTGFKACMETIQGEEACMIDGILLEADNQGYEGEGYANTENASDVMISWEFTASQEAAITVTARFANGGDSPRDAEVFINNNSVGAIDLPVTGGWEIWETVTFTIPVVSGANELRFVATAEEGIANIDALYFSEGVSNTGCIITDVFSVHKENTFKSFPNPFTENIHVTNAKAFDYTIYSDKGTMISEGSCAGNCQLGNELESGIYILEIQNKNQVNRMKIVKE